MINALAITNETAVRASVIQYITGDSLIAGAKAMMIEQLKEKLRNGIASFVFIKKNGVLRYVECATTNPVLVNKWTNGRGISREYYGCCAFLELTLDGIQWRSFKWESIVKVF